MAQWIDVMSVSELRPGMHTVVDLEAVSLLVVNIEGDFYAIEDVCSHDGSEFDDGEINGSEITCPRHGARFCLKTGAALSAPAFEDIAAYPVRVVGDTVQVFDEER